MTKHIAAVFEKGVLRPEHPVDIPEGEHLQLIVVARRATPTNGNVAQALAEIAALPIEGNSDVFSGSDHDTILYAKD